MHYEGLRDLEDGKFSERVTENLRRENNLEEYVKQKRLYSKTLDNFGVTSTFFKNPDQEDNFTNHAPEIPEQDPSPEILSVLHWLSKYPEHENSLKNILVHEEWIIRASSILACNEFKQDFTLEKTWF